MKKVFAAAGRTPRRNGKDVTRQDDSNIVSPMMVSNGEKTPPEIRGGDVGSSPAQKIDTH